MSTRALLEGLRRQDVRLKVDGLTLRVDAPAGMDAEELSSILREHKSALIRLLERERRKLEDADRRGLVIRFAKEPGYLSVHDPTTGDWHELQASGCPPWMLEDAKARRRRRRGRANR
jgi:predicted metal-dependent hydrolase